ncbi:MAG: 2-oxoacid:ferredoxin oxidoreductase subunit beta [bacterium]
MSATARPTGETLPEAKLTKKDFVTDQEVRWCPGCGDYAILNAVQQVFPELGIPREKMVVVSGIGCSSRFPYYMNTYGFHSIHGRAPAVATGLKIARPELSVWVVTGDGDALAIGGNHIIHLLRRNVGVKVLMFNNRIYGLTKGQYSPTSEIGKKTKSTPHGSVDRPFNPISLAIGMEATFVARSIDVDVAHMKSIIRRAAAHEGTAFVEIYQNCNIFNDGAFEDVANKENRPDNAVYMEHGKPLIYGKNRDKGLRLNGFKLEPTQIGGSVTEQDLYVHDEHGSAAMAFSLSRLAGPPNGPVPLGIFRETRTTTFEEAVHHQVDDVTTQKGKGSLEKLLNSGETWVVS